MVTNADGLVFTELKRLCALTDGNLSRHLQQLQEAGLVEIWKGFHGKRPQTLARITALGRKKFAEYLNLLEGVVNEALNATKITKAP